MAKTYNGYPPGSRTNLEALSAMLDILESPHLKEEDRIEALQGAIVMLLHFQIAYWETHGRLGY